MLLPVCRGTESIVLESKFPEVPSDCAAIRIAVGPTSYITPILWLTSEGATVTGARATFAAYDDEGATDIPFEIGGGFVAPGEVAYDGHNTGQFELEIVGRGTIHGVYDASPP